VVAIAADEDVVADIAVRGELDCRSGQAGGLHHVVTSQGVDRQPVVGRLGAGDVHLGSQPQDGNPVLVPGDLNHVVAVGPLDDDRIGCVVADPAARGPRQIEVDLADAGAGQVVDGDGVGAALGVEVDDLDAVEVHRHVGDIAGEADAAAVGGDVDLL